MKLYRFGVRRWASVLVTLVLVGWTEAQAQTSRYAGCYDVYLGTWSPGPLPSDSIHYLPPTRVQLSERPADDFSGRTRGNGIDAAPGAMPSIHRHIWWNIIADSVQLTWSTGFAGITARVGGSETLRGRGRRFVDVVPSGSYTVPIELARIDCGAPVPEERREHYRFSPTVMLLNGAELTLDSIPREDRAIERLTDRSILVHSGALPPYDGTDRIEVRLNADGSIRAVHLRYPEPVRFSEAVSALKAQFGEPTSVRATPLWATWSSRLMYVSVSESDGRVHIRLVSQRW